MTVTRTCSWCHAPAAVTPGRPAWCDSCGHRADVARLDCDCLRCRGRRAAAAAPDPAPAADLAVRFAVLLDAVGECRAEAADVADHLRRCHHPAAADLVARVADRLARAARRAEGGGA